MARSRGLLEPARIWAVPNRRQSCRRRPSLLSRLARAAPTACPARNAPNISVNAYVVSSVMAASRPRVQSSSYASPQKPEKIATSSTAFPATATATGFTSNRLSSAAILIKDRRSHASATRPTAEIDESRDGVRLDHPQP